MTHIQLFEEYHQDHWRSNLYKKSYCALPEEEDKWVVSITVDNQETGKEIHYHSSPMSKKEIMKLKRKIEKIGHYKGKKIKSIRIEPEGKNELF